VAVVVAGIRLAVLAEAVAAPVTDTQPAEHLTKAVLAQAPVEPRMEMMGVRAGLRLSWAALAVAAQVEWVALLFSLQITTVGRVVQALQTPSLDRLLPMLVVAAAAQATQVEELGALPDQVAVAEGLTPEQAMQQVVQQILAVAVAAV
jgi:hypothetical protein